MAAARIAVLGAGSTGCFIGGCWLAAGLPVFFIGRPRIKAEIDTYGLTVSDFSGFVLVISSKVEAVMPRRPGDVGL